MSLRKSPTMTPAKLAANRRNARNSTGPRSPSGKERSRLNGLRHGGRSKIYGDLLTHALEAPASEFSAVASTLFTPGGLDRQTLASLARKFGKVIDGPGPYTSLYHPRDHDPLEEDGDPEYGVIERGPAGQPKLRDPKK